MKTIWDVSKEERKESPKAYKKTHFSNNISTVNILLHQSGQLDWTEYRCLLAETESKRRWENEYIFYINIISVTFFSQH